MCQDTCSRLLGEYPNPSQVGQIWDIGLEWEGWSSELEVAEGPGDALPGQIFKLGHSRSRHTAVSMVLSQFYST